MDSLGEANKVELENVQTSALAQNIAAVPRQSVPDNIPAAQSR